MDKRLDVDARQRFQDVVVSASQHLGGIDSSLHTHDRVVAIIAVRKGRQVGTPRSRPQFRDDLADVVGLDGLEAVVEPSSHEIGQVSEPRPVVLGLAVHPEDCRLTQSHQGFQGSASIGRR